jgi:hypothetical protein
MIGVLNAILCVLQNLLLAILWAGATVVNALVLAIAGLAAVVGLLLPGMPEPPPPPASGVLQVFAWFYPVGGLLAGLLVFVTLWITVVAIRAALRWVKLL